MSARATPSARSDYPIFYALESRWADNDIYGHINNVAYYAYFDSVVNRFLIEKGGLRPGVVPSWVVHQRRLFLHCQLSRDADAGA